MPISHSGLAACNLFRLAPIAQSAERFHGKEKVQGSIPCRGSQFGVSHERRTVAG